MTNSAFHSLLRPSNLDKLRTAAESTAKKGKFDREEEKGFWRTTPDSAGNAAAVIRFLPAPPPETLPFVMYKRVAFEATNGWYIALSRTTLGEKDPAHEFKNRLYASKQKALMDFGAKVNAKKTYVSNILVLQDKAKPENEGKVFLFRYGVKIFEKIQKAMAKPEFDGDVSFDPFNLIEGANFRLRQKKQFGFPNYDDSMFEAPAPLFKGDEDKLIAMCSQLKPLTEFVTPDKYQTYDELLKFLNDKLGFDSTQYLTAEEAAQAGKLKVTKKPVTSDTDTEDETPTPKASNRWTPPTVDTDDDLDERVSQFDDED